MKPSSSTVEKVNDLSQFKMKEETITTNTFQSPLNSLPGPVSLKFIERIMRQLQNRHKLVYLYASWVSIAWVLHIIL